MSIPGAPRVADHAPRARRERLCNAQEQARSTVYASQVRALSGWTVAESDAPADWTDDAAARTLTARFTKP